MQKGDLFGMFLVADPDDLAAGGAAGAHQTLMLKGGEDVVEPPPAIGAQDLLADPTEAGSEHHAPHREIKDLFPIVKTDGAGPADHRTEAATLMVQLQAGLGIDVITGGHRLGVIDMGGMGGAQVFVVLIADLLQAVKTALTAAVADLLVDVTGLFLHPGGEAARPALQRDQFGLGEDLDVSVPARLHQLGGQDAEGAVVGGKGLVEAGHHPADGRALFNQIDLVAQGGEVESGLNAGDTAADHHYCAADVRVWI